MPWTSGVEADIWHPTPPHTHTYTHNKHGIAGSCHDAHGQRQGTHVFVNSTCGFISNAVFWWLFLFYPVVSRTAPAPSSESTSTRSSCATRLKTSVPYSSHPLYQIITNDPTTRPLPTLQRAPPVSHFPSLSHSCTPQAEHKPAIKSHRFRRTTRAS